MRICLLMDVSAYMHDLGMHVRISGRVDDRMQGCMYGWSLHGNMCVKYTVSTRNMYIIFAYRIGQIKKT